MTTYKYASCDDVALCGVEGRKGGQKCPEKCRACRFYHPQSWGSSRKEALVLARALKKKYKGKRGVAIRSVHDLWKGHHIDSYPEGSNSLKPWAGVTLKTGYMIFLGE